MAHLSRRTFLTAAAVAYLKELIPAFESKTGMTVDFAPQAFPIYNQHADLELSTQGGAWDFSTSPSSIPAAGSAPAGSRLSTSSSTTATRRRASGTPPTSCRRAVVAPGREGHDVRLCVGGRRHADGRRLRRPHRQGGTAASAAKALARLEQRRPDVILCDIGMPDQDGYALIRDVRRLSALRGGNVPAVAVTAYGRVEDRVRSLAAGYDMHITKPVEPGALVALVASLVTGSTA